jgi:PAS domain S-box-containing protein
VIDARAGVVRWLAARGQAVFVNGTPVRVVGTVQDMTERKIAEVRLRDSEAHFRAMANAAPAMLWITEPGGRCSFLSTRWYEYTGQSEGEGLGYGWLDAVHPDDRESSRVALGRADVRREAFSIDHRVRRSDGVYRWVIDQGRPRFDAAGNFAGFVGSVIDMHAQRKALEAFHESEQRFRALADNISQFAWMADAGGEIFWYNRRWYEYTGTTLDQMRGWGWTSVHHPDHIDQVVAQWRHALAFGEDWESTFPLRGIDGCYRWFLTRASPIRDAQGRILRWFGTNTDITDQRAAEAALLEADRRKDEFLAVLAHELRNPLAPLRNSLQLLKMQSDPALGARLRVIMERQVDTLVRLVDDLLDVSRITHGKLQLDAARIDLCEAMRAALEACAPIIESARHRLDLDIPAQSVPVWGDHVRLAQVFSNLLNNAARYTPAPGIVRFSVRVDGGTAIVEVADNGVGIAPDMLERVFDMFAQAPGSTDHALHGLGIGLSLSRSLVTLHGGTIFAQSEGLGCGSRFIVRLSVLADEASTTPCAKSGSTGC